MAEQIWWLDGEAKVPGEIEKICPGRHITQKQWRPEWNDMYLTRTNSNSYDYISDYECIFNHPIKLDHYVLESNQKGWQNLQAAKTKGTNLLITNVAHFTKPEAAEMIIEDKGFGGRAKKIDNDDCGYDVQARLSWWSPLFTKVERNLVQAHLGRVIQPFLTLSAADASLHNQFATSDAFLPNLGRRYGNTFFSYRIQDLCTDYANLVGDDVRYKILGTFGYKQEIMHAVLVCSQAYGKSQFAAYPNVPTPVADYSNEAVITRDENGNWLWKPQATATEINRLQCTPQNFPKYRRWENVAFAFHIPDQWTVMTVSDIFNHRFNI